MTPRKSDERLVRSFKHSTVAAHLANVACSGADLPINGEMFEHPDMYDQLLERIPGLHQAIDQAGRDLELSRIDDEEEFLTTLAEYSRANLSDEDEARLDQVMLGMVNKHQDTASEA